MSCNQEENIDNTENIDDIEQKMSFLDSFLSVDDKKDSSQYDEDEINKNNQSGSTTDTSGFDKVFGTLKNSSIHHKINSLKEFFRKNKEKKRKNTHSYSSHDIIQTEFFFLGLSFFILILLCYLFGLFSFFIVATPVFLVGFVLYEKKEDLIKHLQIMNNDSNLNRHNIISQNKPIQQVQHNEEDIELTQSLLNI